MKRGYLLMLVAVLAFGGAFLANRTEEEVKAEEPKYGYHEILIPRTPTPAPERPDFELSKLSCVISPAEAAAGRADEKEEKENGSICRGEAVLQGHLEGPEVSGQNNEGSGDDLRSDEETDGDHDQDGGIDAGDDGGFERDPAGGDGGAAADDQCSAPESGSDEGSDGTDELISLGCWTITAYCPCEICCGQWASGYTASGVPAAAGHTIACNVLPFGTQVMIDGVIYTVEDTGAGPCDEWIDIYFDSHEEALAFGLRMEEVFLVN